MKLPLLLTLILTAALPACGQKPALHGETAPRPKPSAEALAKDTIATFASGCFWCVESVFESVKGVDEVISGYAGGNSAQPTYEQVSSGRTDHAEAVQVYYDPEKVSYQTLLDVYFGSQDPTQKNGQGPDRGRQYRSVIFYRNEAEKTAAQAAKSALEAKLGQSVAAEIVSLGKFWPAEDYHQDYEHHNPGNPYIQSVSIPRLNRFKERFPNLLK